MKKLVLATALIAFTTSAQAFIPKHRIAEEVKITDQFLIIEDIKTKTEWKIDTDCDIKLTDNMSVSTRSVVKEDARLLIKGDKSRQVCRVTDISKL